MRNPYDTRRRAIFSRRRWRLSLFIALAVVLGATLLLRSGSEEAASPSLGAVAVAAATPIPPAPQDTGPKIGFENFEGPGTLTQVTTSSQGQPINTVEYIAHD